MGPTARCTESTLIRARRELYARGLEDPCGVIFVGSTLWAADRKGVYRVTRGKVELVYPAKSFPRPLHFLNDLAVGHGGSLYVSDTGDSTAAGHGAVFRLAPGKRPTVLAGSDTVRGAVQRERSFHRRRRQLVHRGISDSGVLSVTDGKGRWRNLAQGLGSPDGIDAAPGNGLLHQRQCGRGSLLGSSEAGAKPVKIVSGLQVSGRSDSGPEARSSGRAGEFRESSQHLQGE